MVEQNQDEKEQICEEGYSLEAEIARLQEIGSEKAIQEGILELAIAKRPSLTPEQSSGYANRATALFSLALLKILQKSIEVRE